MTTPLDRIQSNIPSPASKYGYRLNQPTFSKIAVFNGGGGQTIPAFLLQNQSDPRKVREFLRINKIGSAFDLEPGIEVRIP
jgi:hypothetical protein